MADSSVSRFGCYTNSRAVTLMASFMREEPPLAATVTA
jgi:hypothetical protein